MPISLACSHAKAKPYMTKEHLTKFINQKQRDPRLNSLLFPPARPEQVQVLIDKYEPSGINVQRGEDQGNLLLPRSPVAPWGLSGSHDCLLSTVSQASCHQRGWSGFSVDQRTVCWPTIHC